MGNVSDLDIARRRRVVSRFCTECHTPWALRAVFELGGRGQTDRPVVNCQSPESPPGTGTAT